MAWLKDVRDCVSSLPSEFSLRDLDPFLPRLHKLHPANNHVADKLRQQLQVLRDEGELQFLGDGRYLRLGSETKSWPLKVRDETTREELANILGMAGSAALNRGMFKRATGPFANDLLLFHNAESNPYGDSLTDSDRIVYVGQGMNGDQQLDGHNRALHEHLENGTRVHFFVKEARGGTKLTYEGPVILERTERVYREDEGRSVLEFHLIPDQAGQHQNEFGRAYQEVLENDLEPFIQLRPVRTSVVSKVIRSRAFAAHVLQQYEQHCAVCGETLTRFDHDARDLQGAHIRAVAAGGPDARNNGLALCARHHWAFDNGVFSLTDDHKLMSQAGFIDPHGEIEIGERIRLPRDTELAPHAKYLHWHRINWNLHLN